MARTSDIVPAPLLPAYDAWAFLERMAKIGRSDEPGYEHLRDKPEIDRQTLDELINEARRILDRHTS